MPDSAAFDFSRPQRVAAAGAPESLVAVRLAEWGTSAGRSGLLFIARSETRLERLSRALASVAPAVERILLPPWDCLPYDRAAPSPSAMGRRMEALRRLALPPPAAGRVVLTTVDAAMQRLPSAAPEALELRVGGALDIAALEAYLRRAGYVLDERVDEPGEAAIRGEVIDLYPAAAVAPCRIDHDDGKVTGLRQYDAVSQRTIAELDRLALGPASELVVADAAERFPGIEHWLPEHCERLTTVFQLLSEAPLVLDVETPERRAAFREQVEEAFQSRLVLGGAERRAGHKLPAPIRPSRLYLEEAEWEEALAGRAVVALTDDRAATLPDFDEEGDAAANFTDFVAARRTAGDRVGLVAVAERDLRRVLRLAERQLDCPLTRCEGWEEFGRTEPGTVAGFLADFESGFSAGGTTIVAFADLGLRRASRAGQGSAAAALPGGDFVLRVGDAVIHAEHGMAVLRGLERIEPDGRATETIKLAYAGESALLVPTEDGDRLWRYGAAAEGVTLDRLGGDAWAKRRAAMEAEIAKTAKALAEVARAREEATAPTLLPPAGRYAAFARRFPYSETPDQTAAIEAVLRDLAAGRPMDRLVCGDVGFGKTEVALRAAAAAAFAGKQVAIVAPTTVLVRQHLETFRRRFAGFAIRVESLSRLSKPTAARKTREGLADGTIQLVVGTHALAGKNVRFHDLGLLVIDEEQRFGAKQKEKLRALGRDVHVLTLTATPIPRTMQAAAIGLQDISTIATPPARRRPIRTFVMPFDAASVREALRREERRGGQSFVVCPQIEDLAPLGERLAGLVPELDILSAHGKLPGDELDEIMVRFADGEGDILLATNIVESGLDVPRANTMIVWRADRFGMAQLHQLRGRVGRGRARGVAYLLTDPAAKIAKATEKRLRTLEAMDRVGAGFAISARDLDLRGAGDLLGEAQAGHLKLVGVELYYDLLRRALVLARGGTPEETWKPELRLDVPALIPADYIPEEEVRLNLYLRLGRLASQRETDAFAAEIEDRFGEPPPELLNLLETTRLRLLCRRLGIAVLEAGPQAVALTFRGGPPALAKVDLDKRMEWRGERLLFRQPSADAEARLAAAREALRLTQRAQRASRGKEGVRRRRAG